jgi:hypothetical protein
VSEVVKFRTYTHIFKVEFATTEMARRAAEDGFLCCHMKISPSQIQQEKYIDLLMCFTCYKYEDHLTKDCPTPKAVRCSECSGEHSYRDCKEDFKKCLNCDKPHRTMAMSCPIKKELIKKKMQKKEDEEVSKQESTYARVVTQAISSARQEQKETATSGILADNGMRALMMILDAHVHNIISPGSYNDHLNRTLQANNIEPIVFEPNPNSAQLFNQGVLGETLSTLNKKGRKKQGERRGSTTSSSGESSSTDSSESTVKEITVELSPVGIPELSPVGIPEGAPQRGGSITDPEDTLNRHLMSDGMHLMDVKSAKDYDTTLNVSEGAAKKKDLTAPEVKKLYKDNKLKYRIDYLSKYSSEQVDRLILAEKIRGDKEDLNHVPAAKFKKMLNGTEGSTLTVEEGMKLRFK